MLNKAILVGRLTADPELKTTTSGISVCSFSIAIDRPYRSGAERQTDFIDIVAWRQTAEFVSKYFRKGSAIIIDGAIQTRSYTDKEGNKRRAFEVVASNVSFAERKASESGGDFKGNYEAPPQPNVSYENGDIGEFQMLSTDEDLPF